LSSYNLLLNHNPVKPRWISFDCFGTLVDWRTGFARILEPVAGKMTAQLLNAYHRHEKLVEAEQPIRSYKEVLALSLSRAANEIGLTLGEEHANVLSKEWHCQPVFEDVEPALAHLRSAGWKLAVLTNCDEDLFERTHRCFRERFDLEITAERVRSYKPAKAHFKFFRQQTGVRTEDWVHVACSWFHDITPARELGLRHVWLDRDRENEKAAGTPRIYSAADLMKAIQ
jgi:2-haloacid dehalogenase